MTEDEAVGGSTGDTRTFYRITRRNPPRSRDFWSNARKGRRPTSESPQFLRLWEGVSVYDSEEWAREQALGLPAMGGFIAALRIVCGDRIRCEQTGRDPHHFTLWGEPEILIGCIVSVVRV
jgi:hypothetical protein